MKGKFLKSLGLVVVVTAVMLVVLVFAASASPKAPEQGDGPKETLCPLPSDGSKQKDWCALDRVDRFQETLEDAGFDLQEGNFEFWDLVKDTCEPKFRMRWPTIPGRMRTFRCTSRRMRAYRLR